MQHVYLHISAHKTHISATLTSCLLCVGYFFHLFFLPPSCFSLSLRAEAGCWETVDSVFTFVLPLLSLSFFCFVTQRDMSCHMVHSLRQTQGRRASLSPTFQSPSLILPLPPSHFSPGSILRQELETQSCADVYQPIPRPCIAFLSESVSEPLILDRYD